MTAMWFAEPAEHYISFIRSYTIPKAMALLAASSPPTVTNIMSLDPVNTSQSGLLYWMVAMPGRFVFITVSMSIRQHSRELWLEFRVWQHEAPSYRKKK